MRKTIGRIWLGLMVALAILCFAFRDVVTGWIGLSATPGAIVTGFMCVSLLAIGLAPAFLFRRG